MRSIVDHPAFARRLGLAVAAVYAAAAVVVAIQPFAIAGDLRATRWSVYGAHGAVLALIAFLAAAASLLHALLTAGATVVTFMFVVAHAESDSPFAPLVALTLAALVFVLVRRRAEARAVGRVPTTLLALSAVAALVAVVKLQEAKDVLLWQRFRTVAGEAELRTWRSEGSCPSGDRVRDVGELEYGCAPIMPERRAWVVIASSAISAAFGGAASVAARARAGRRDEPWASDTGSL